jgi:hypothetical protein
MEYQGLSSGDAEKDAQPLRFMAHEGIPLVLAQSFDSVGVDDSVGMPPGSTDHDHATTVDGTILGQSYHRIRRRQHRER